MFLEMIPMKSFQRICDTQMLFDGIKDIVPGCILFQVKLSFTIDITISSFRYITQGRKFSYSLHISSSLNKLTFNFFTKTLCSPVDKLSLEYFNVQNWFNNFSQYLLKNWSQLIHGQSTHEYIQDIMCTFDKYCHITSIGVIFCHLKLSYLYGFFFCKCASY